MPASQGCCCRQGDLQRERKGIMCYQSYFIRTQIDWLRQFNHYCLALIYKEEHSRHECLYRSMSSASFIFQCYCCFKASNNTLQRLILTSIYWPCNVLKSLLIFPHIATLELKGSTCVLSGFEILSFKVFVFQIAKIIYERSLFHTQKELNVF